MKAGGIVPLNGTDANYSILRADGKLNVG